MKPLLLYSYYFTPVFNALFPEIAGAGIGAEGIPELHHGSVVGEQEHGILLFFQLFNKSLVVGEEFGGFFGGAGLLQAGVEVLCLVPSHIEFLQVGVADQFFVIRGLDPGNIVAVASAVVEAENSTEILTQACYIGESLVAACGILDQDHLQSIALKIKGLETSEGSTSSGQRVDGLLCGQV